jgi:hypothetical protein
MRLLSRLLLLLLLLTPVALAAGLWLALDEQPRVLQGATLSHQDIARARAILQRNDPRDLPAGTRHRLVLSQQDLNLAANYLLQRYGGAAAVMLETRIAYLDATLRIPRLPLRPYLNVSLELREDEASPRLGGVRIGQLELPDGLARWLLRRLVGLLGQGRSTELALHSVQQLTVRPGQLSLLYEWHPELLETMRDDLLPAHQQQAIAAYYHELAGLHASNTARRGSLPQALAPLFALAAERSRTGDPVAENRALLAMLGAWASGRGMDRLLPPQQRQATLRGFGLRLQRRTDFAQHFLISAGLAANSDRLLSDAVGLYKEVRDSEHGSGFSFTDIAADRAGTHFGEFASASAAQARRLQRSMAAGATEDQLMPATDDLPEHMAASEFTRRFGGIDSPAYRRLMADIEARIARLPLYRE